MRVHTAAPKTKGKKAAHKYPGGPQRANQLECAVGAGICCWCRPKELACGASAMAGQSRPPTGLRPTNRVHQPVFVQRRVLHDGLHDGREDPGHPRGRHERAGRALSYDHVEGLGTNRWMPCSAGQAQDGLAYGLAYWLAFCLAYCLANWLAGVRAGELASGLAGGFACRPTVQTVRCRRANQQRFVC
jgi:hypothetical protein